MKEGNPRRMRDMTEGKNHEQKGGKRKEENLCTRKDGKKENLRGGKEEKTFEAERNWDWTRRRKEQKGAGDRNGQGAAWEKIGCTRCCRGEMQ
jgi:hypothetical protein